MIKRIHEVQRDEDGASAWAGLGTDSYNFLLRSWFRYDGITHRSAFLYVPPLRTYFKAERSGEGFSFLIHAPHLVVNLG